MNNPIITLIIAFGFILCFGNAFIYAENTTGLNNTVEEIQHATCNISTKDAQATANVTITRQLKGVCTSNEMHKCFKELESKIFKELQAIKVLLEKMHVNYNEGSNDKDDYVKPKGLDIGTTYNSKKILKSHERTQNNVITTTEESNNGKSTSYQRNFEAIKNNGTIQETELGKSFLYFWKVFDVDDTLSYYDTYVESPVFYFRGQCFQIKLHPHYLGSQYNVLQLSSDSQFNLKHRFTILNQRNANGDLASQVLGTKATIFKVSNKKITNGEFIVDGNLLVKLVIAFHI